MIIKLINIYFFFYLEYKQPSAAGILKIEMKSSDVVLNISVFS